MNDILQVDSYTVQVQMLSRHGGMCGWIGATGKVALLLILLQYIIVSSDIYVLPVRSKPPISLLHQDFAA